MPETDTTRAIDELLDLFPMPPSSGSTGSVMNSAANNNTANSISTTNTADGDSPSGSVSSSTAQAAATTQIGRSTSRRVLVNPLPPNVASPASSSTSASQPSTPTLVYGGSTIATATANVAGTPYKRTASLTCADSPPTSPTTRRGTLSGAATSPPHSPAFSQRPPEDIDYVEYLTRACRGVFPEDQRKTLYDYLVDLPPADIHALQEHVHASLNEDIVATSQSKFKIASSALKLTKSSGKTSHIEASKHRIDFHGGKKIALEQLLTDTIELNRTAGKDKVNFVFHLPPPTRGCTLTVTPVSGVVKKKQPEPIRITLFCKSPQTVKCVLRLEVEGGLEHFFSINVVTEDSMFGVAPSTLEFVEDHGRNVPQVLHILRHCLADNNGLKTKQVFMMAAEEETVKAMKRDISRGTFTGSSDVHASASAIKAWFRELPCNLFEGVQTYDVLTCNDRAKAVKLYSIVNHLNRTLLDWLFDLLVEVASYGSANGMDLKKLGICIAPHIWNNLDSASLNTADSLRLSQQTVFVTQWLLESHK